MENDSITAVPKTLDSLVHHTVDIANGGKVIVLDTGAIIGPESEAMLQALHSRSIGGLMAHLKILKDRGSDNFMKNFYVGYGHKSIGDCGSGTIFIEGVSMLVAKAVQDSPLYSGQEASTRYIDFEFQPFKNPVDTKEGEDILEAWRAFYVESLPKMKEYLKTQHPIGEGESVNIYDKAIAARAFDILRGFLPAGGTTNIAWHTNLRQAADKVMTLRHHPLAEVRDTAEAIEQALQLAYPNSFGHKRYEETEKYNELYMKNSYYYHNDKCEDFKLLNNSIDTNLLPKSIIEARPPKTELPRHIAEAGNVQFEFTLDFGSYRDLQRHRAVTQRMPLLTTELGFESWYLSELSDEVRSAAEKLLKEQSEKIASLSVSKEDKQYYTAMGYKTSNRITGNLPALVYLVELRATRFVHPTLRKRAKQMVDTLTELFSASGLTIHLDPDIDRFDIKRGEHDIVLK